VQHLTATPSLCRFGRGLGGEPADIRDWLSLVIATGAVVVGIGYRIRVEERAMVIQLGDSYRR
jgi:protein-S-isoprenylcysteine O-methyltransferase Ste14